MTAGASAAERVRPGTRWVLLAVGFLWVYNGVNFLAFKVGVDALPAAFLAATRFTLLGYGVFSWVNQTVSSTLANSYNYVAPVITLVLASLFLGERLNWSKAAAAVALGGVALMVSGKASSRPEAA